MHITLRVNQSINQDTPLFSLPCALFSFLSLYFTLRLIPLPSLPPLLLTLQWLPEKLVLIPTAAAFTAIYFGSHVAFLMQRGTFSQVRQFEGEARSASATFQL